MSTHAPQIYDDFTPADMRPADESAGFPRIDWTAFGRACDAFLAKRETHRLSFRDFVRAEMTNGANAKRAQKRRAA